MNLLNQIRLNKKYIWLLFFVATLGFLYLIYDNYNKNMSKYYTEYLKIKEMKFLVKNQIKTNLKSDEHSLSTFFKSKGFDVESIGTFENGIEIKLKEVNPVKLVKTIYELEKNGIKILSLKAVDNTGLGEMSVKLVLK
jgi:hypothetical protein